MASSDRKLHLNHLLNHNFAITNSAKERVRSRLVEVAIEDSPVKGDAIASRRHFPGRWDKSYVIDDRETELNINREEPGLDRIRSPSPTPSHLSDSSSASSSRRRSSPSSDARRLRNLRKSTKLGTKSPSRRTDYSFVNEVSIPTIHLPEQPISPPRFRRRLSDRGWEESRAQPILTKEKRRDKGSVRFDLGVLEDDYRSGDSPGDDDTKGSIASESSGNMSTTFRTPPLATSTPSDFVSHRITALPSLHSSDTFETSKLHQDNIIDGSPSRLLRHLSRASLSPSPHSQYHSLSQTPYPDITPLRTFAARRKGPNKGFPSDFPASNSEATVAESKEKFNEVKDEENESISETEQVLDEIVEEASATLQHIQELVSCQNSIEQREENNLALDEGKSFWRMGVGGWAFTPQVPRVREVLPEKLSEMPKPGLKESNVGRVLERLLTFKRPGKINQSIPSKNGIVQCSSVPAESSPRTLIDESVGPLLKARVPQLPRIKRSLSSNPTNAEKRLHLAKSLQDLQSDIRLAREGIEALERRLHPPTTVTSNVSSPLSSSNTEIVKVEGRKEGVFVYIPFSGILISILTIVLVWEVFIWIGIEAGRRGYGLYNHLGGGWDGHSDDWRDWGEGGKWPT